jgi:hypothetical protein
MSVSYVSDRKTPRHDVLRIPVVKMIRRSFIATMADPAPDTPTGSLEKHGMAVRSLFRT